MPEPHPAGTPPGGPVSPTLRIDTVFGPFAGLLCGVLGGVLGLVAQHGWRYVWPLIGVFAVIGGAGVFMLARSAPAGISRLVAIVSFSLLAANVTAALWGVISRVGL